MHSGNRNRDEKKRKKPKTTHFSCSVTETVFVWQCNKSELCSFQYFFFSSDSLPQNCIPDQTKPKQIIVNKNNFILFWNGKPPHHRCILLVKLNILVEGASCNALMLLENRDYSWFMSMEMKCKALALSEYPIIVECKRKKSQKIWKCWLHCFEKF